ncbi:MAG: hypothetical protein C7B46_03935 [Sulfobacillus benefaciens]|uniref:Uncharacterized protein n=1 Tax=Sulfobacillus benefaciens TaxID=453960 RepID=A0A2T2XJE3_9FIRM|nr:MAG: hypothetical protein C7B46_03935 [Sulfobacillus benefaciens]
MHDLLLISRIRLRQATSQILYALRVLGVDTSKTDWVTYTYGLYLVGVFAGWTTVSWAGVLHLVASNPWMRPTWIIIIPPLLTFVAVVSWARALGTVPFKLAHGDLELLAPSPISRRALAASPWIVQQVKAALIQGFLGSLIVAFFHGVHRHLWIEVELFALWGMGVSGWGFVWSSLRVMSARKPRHWLWLLPLFGAIAVGAWSHTALLWPAHWVVLPLTIQSQAALRPQEVLGLMVVFAWTAALAVSGKIHLISIQEASALYADMRALGTVYAPNPQLVRDMVQASRLRGRRARGNMPTWHPPFAECGRLYVVLLRSPGQAFALLEIALLIRSALLLIFSSHTGIVWLFWLVACYRFQRGSTTFLWQRNANNAFIRQFWPDTLLERMLRSSVLPLSIVTGLSVLLWWLLPLGVPLSVKPALTLLALVIAWHFAETFELMRKLPNGSGAVGTREARTIGMGMFLFAAIVLHKLVMAWALTAILVFIVFRQGVSEFHRGTSSVGIPQD